MRQRNQFMIVFSMLLMLCGQTLASALMWCCLAHPAPAEAAMDMAMMHAHHAHVMPAADDAAAAMPSPHGMDLSHSLSDLLDCEHSCASSCSNVVVLAAVLPQQAPAEFALVVADAVPALPQADPSLLLRPPNAA